MAVTACPETNERGYPTLPATQSSITSIWVPFGWHMAERSPVCGIPAGFLRKSNASTPTLALAPAPAPVAALPLALEMDATAIRPISVVAGSDSDEEELLLKGSRSRPCTSFSPPAQIAASNVAGPVPSPHLAASGPSALVVGTLVNVYLHKHKGWFAGRVVEVWRLIDGTKHRVLFDDGDLLWINFSYGYERFEVLGKVVETSSLLEVADGSGRGAGSKRARASLESSVAEAHWSLRGALHGASGFPLTDADGGAGGSSGSGAAAAPADASDAAAHGAVASAERRERRPKRLNFSRPCPRCGEENHVRRLECEVCGLVLKEPVSKRRAAAAAEAALEAALCYARYVGAERAPAEPGEDGDQGEEAAAGNDENFVSMVHHRAEMDKLEHKFKAELQKQVRKVESRFEGKLQAIERRFERRLERHLGVRALEDPDDEQSDAEGDGVSDSSERDKEEEHVVEEEQPSCSSTPPKRQRLAAP